jgi:hypothetical protein
VYFLVSHTFFGTEKSEEKKMCIETKPSPPASIVVVPFGFLHFELEAGRTWWQSAGARIFFLLEEMLLKDVVFFKASSVRSEKINSVSNKLPSNFFVGLFQARLLLLK